MSLPYTRVGLGGPSAAYLGFTAKTPLVEIRSLAQAQGSYAPSLACSGRYVPTLDATGSVVDTLAVAGSIGTE